MTISGEASRGTQNKIYRALCQALSNPHDDLPWRSFRDSEWESLLNMARAHGVAGLLYRAVQSNDWGAAFPPTVLDQLAQVYYRNAAHNQLLFDELRRILGALHQAQVPVIVLKGAALAHTLYPDPGLRPMNDLDLMVKPEDLLRAIDVLEKVGYQQQNFIFHVVLTRGPKYRTTVELHWRVYPANETTPNADEWFWSEAQQFKNSQYSSCYALSPLAAMLFNAAHLIFVHGSENPRLIWYYDNQLLATVPGTPLDWDELLTQSRAFSWNGPLYHALRMTQERFNTRFPGDFLAELGQDEWVDGIRVEETVPADLELSILTCTWYAYGTLDWRARFRAVRGLLFPTEAYMKMYYEPEPFWFWRVYYPVQLVFKNVVNLVFNIRNVRNKNSVVLHNS